MELSTNVRAWLPDDKVMHISQLRKLIQGNFSFRLYMQKQDYALMFSTGLKDRNGREIFEGDIVEDKFMGCNFKIEYWRGSFCLYNKAEGYIPLFMWDDNKAKGLTVIGNIFEHPYLLTF